MDRSYSPHAPSKPLAISQWLRAIGHWIGRYWQRALLLAFILVIVLKKDIAINLQMNGSPKEEIAALGQNLWQASPADPRPSALPTVFPAEPSEEGSDTAHDLPSQPVTEQEEDGPSLLVRLASWFGLRPASPQETAGHPANTFSSFSFSGKEGVSTEARRKKQHRQINYIHRYLEVAQHEREQFGIPVSITLAQGLLESDAGYSGLAKQNNNHFGIKCFSKSCAKGHCRNFSDDHHKDFFRIYASPWESYRAHSLLLQKSRYRHLKKLDPRDYRSWAEGLQRAGYATDPNYARKLIYLIEDLGLDRYDA